jgi:hypothetical protein
MGGGGNSQVSKKKQIKRGGRKVRFNINIVARSVLLWEQSGAGKTASGPEAVILLIIGPRPT